MELGLQDRVYVVTGASKGLGLAGARALVEEGARVVLCSRDEVALTAAARDLGASDRALAVSGDLAAEDTPSRLVAAAMGRWGRLDGALVSVGGPPPGSASIVGDDVWRVAFETVFLGPLRVARAVASTLGPEGGSIALVLSSSVRQPAAGLAVSNGLRPGPGDGRQDAGRRARRPRHPGQRAAAGARSTPTAIRELDAAGGRPVPPAREREATVPLRRYGEPDEFGRVAAFVLSPAASYVTGAMIAGRRRDDPRAVAGQADSSATAEVVSSWCSNWVR